VGSGQDKGLQHSNFKPLQQLAQLQGRAHRKHPACPKGITNPETISPQEKSHFIMILKQF